MGDIVNIDATSIKNGCLLARSMFVIGKPTIVGKRLVDFSFPGTMWAPARTLSVRAWCLTISVACQALRRRQRHSVVRDHGAVAASPQLP